MILTLLAAILVQEAESAETSKLTAAPLPAGAFRILDPAQIEKSGVILKAVYKDLPLVRVEVLLWAGDHRGAKGADLRGRAGKALEKAGFTWKDVRSDQQFEGNDVHLSAASREKRRFLGVWLASAEGALLVWGEDPAAASVEAEFGNVVYAVPKGWKVEAVGADGVTLVPVDPLPEEKLFLLILAGRPYAGRLEEDAGRLWTEACEAFQVTGQPWPSERIPARRSFKGWDYVRYATTVRRGDAELFLSVTFIRVGDRLERVAALSNWVSQPYKESPLTSPRYSAAVQGFPFTLKFKNHAEPELPPPVLVGDGIVGLWTGISMGVKAFSGRAEWTGYTAAFYADGRAFFANRLPTNAFEGMNPYHQAEESPRWWGTWTFRDGRGVLKMPFGEIPLEAKGPDLVLTTMKTPHTYQRIPPVDGARFEGTWTMSEHEGKVPSLTLGADGKFKDEGALKVLEHNLYRLYGVAAKPGEGSYEVKNYTMLFRYSDGREFAAAFLGYGCPKGETRPAMLILGYNQDPLRRR